MESSAPFGTLSVRSFLLSFGERGFGVKGGFPPAVGSLPPVGGLPPADSFDGGF